MPTTRKAPPKRKPTTGGKPPKTGSRGADKGLNRIQREAARTLENLEREEMGLAPRPLSRSERKQQRPPSIRKKVVARIPKKYKVGRAVAHVVLGTAVVAGRGGRVGGRAAARAARAAHHRARTSRTADNFRRPPSNGSTPPRRFGGVKTACLHCGHTYYSMEELNRHFLDTHDKEKPAERVARPVHTIHRGATARTHGKTIVNPATRRTRRTPAGRHHKAPHRRRAVDYVAAYRANLKEIEARMNSAAARAVENGAKMMVDEVPREKALEPLQELMVGLGRAFDVLEEELGNLQIRLIRDEVDADLVLPHFTRMRENATGLARNAVSFLADFQAIYALHIRAVKGNVTTPPLKYFAS